LTYPDLPEVLKSTAAVIAKWQSLSQFGPCKHLDAKSLEKRMVLLAEPILQQAYLCRNLSEH